jgi:hypothetical protein
MDLPLVLHWMSCNVPSCPVLSLACFFNRAYQDTVERKCELHTPWLTVMAAAHFQVWGSRKIRLRSRKSQAEALGKRSCKIFHLDNRCASAIMRLPFYELVRIRPVFVAVR